MQTDRIAKLWLTVGSAAGEPKATNAMCAAPRQKSMWKIMRAAVRTACQNALVVKKQSRYAPAERPIRLTF